MNVFVAGATGAIGRPLVRRLIEDGHAVAGLTRSTDGAAVLAERGAAAAVADVYDAESLTRVMAESSPEVVIHQLTALPKRLDLGKLAEELAPTNRLRTEGTDRLIAAARSAGARRFIAQSIAFAYAPNGSAPRTETDPLLSDPLAGFGDAVNAIKHLENAVTQADGLQGIVLRYGQLYGPGTVYASDGSMAEDVRSRKVPVIGSGRGAFSFIHVEDAASGCLSALSGPAGIYNIVDDNPVQARDWLPFYADLLSAPPPRRVPALIARLLAGPYPVYLMTKLPPVSNRKARATLGWRPRFPDWEQGFRSDLCSR